MYAYIEDQDGVRLAMMSLEQGIYKFDMPKDQIYLANKKVTAEMWHKRLGHLNYESIKIQ